MCKYLNNYSHDIYLQLHAFRENEAMHFFDKNGKRKKDRKSDNERKKTSQWFSFARYTMFRYGFFKAGMVTHI